MKNIGLLVSFAFFSVVAILQYLRYYFQVEIIIGGNHHIPLELSFYGSIVIGVVALFMLIAALVKK